MTDILEGLNPKQQKAVKIIDRPLLVFAGPGTGKTMVVVHKIAHLIREHGMRPDRVVALTFSVKAAGEMRLRVEELLPGVTGVTVSTFHSFCYELLREHSLELAINADSPVLTDEYQQSFLYQHIDDIGIKHFKIPARPTDLVKKLQGAISRFKQENITVELLEAYLEANRDSDDEDIGKLRDLAGAYRLYEEFKEHNGFLDFGDMQSLAIRLLDDHPGVLRDRIGYLIVDEFQDTDLLQLELIKRLAPGGNITVVGDDDQSIYKFRGAYTTSVREFMSTYRNAMDVVLDTNYRCTGNIQTAATNLIRNNTQRQDKSIRTKKEDREPVIITEYPDDWHQAVGITDTIKKMDPQNNDPGQFAILVRRRVDAIPIVEMLTKNNLPFEVIGSKEYFREPVVKAAVSYLKVLFDPDRYQPSLGNIMLRPVHGIMPGEIPRLNGYARKKGLTLWGALCDLEGYDGDRNALAALREELLRLHRLHGEMGVHSLVRSVLFGKDLFRLEISADNAHNIRLLNRFLQLTGEILKIYPEENLEELLDHLHVMEELGIEDSDASISTDRVHIMTIHASKGKQFPYVFIPCINEKRLPTNFRNYKINIPADLLIGERSDTLPEKLHEEEERRLLYVAITRASEQVRASYCRNYTGNKSVYRPSRFIEEIRKGGAGFTDEIAEEKERDVGNSISSVEGWFRHRIIRGIARQEWQSVIDAVSAMAAREMDISTLAIPGNMDVENYLSDLEKDYTEPEQAHRDASRYSQSKLNCYSNCPLKYRFQYVLQIPDEPHDFFDLGTACHSTVEMITRRIKGGDTVSEADALDILESFWPSGAYDSVEKEKQDHEDARVWIRNFLKHQAVVTSDIMAMEMPIEIDLDGRKVVGYIDRVDDDGGHLRIYDYKTSKKMTSRPQLKKDLQLVVYWEAAEHAFGKPVDSVGHWYLRHDEERMVEITPEERREVLDRALGIIKEIEAGRFEAKVGYLCNYCGYKELCNR